MDAFQGLHPVRCEVGVNVWNTQPWLVPQKVLQKIGRNAAMFFFLILLLPTLDWAKSPKKKNIPKVSQKTIEFHEAEK